MAIIVSIGFENIPERFSTKAKITFSWSNCFGWLCYVSHQEGDWLTVWPDWAIYWTLGNFSKLLALINLSRSPTFLGNFCKGVKIFYFFLVKSFLGNFIDIWRLFTGHTDCTQPRHKDDKLNIWNFFVHLILFKAQFTRSGFHASVWQDRNVSKHKNFHFSVNGAIWKQ